MNDPQLASSDPAGHQQAHTDAAADAGAPETTTSVEVEVRTENLAADLSAIQAEVDGYRTECDSLRAQVAEAAVRIDALTELSNTLSAEKNELLQKIGERDATITSLYADKADLVTQVQSARVEFATAEFDEERLHNLWCAAGGKLGDFETAKRFVASL